MSDFDETLRAIHTSGRRLVIAATGGGTGAIAALLQTPGASRSILEAVVPYGEAALADWIGGPPEQACSEPTARAMAMAAFMRARRLAPDADPRSLVGVGFTGSLATDRPKRGQRRLHMAAQTAEQTEAHTLLLTDEAPTRTADEQRSTEALVWLVARACAAPVSAFAEFSSQPWRSAVERAASERAELLLGERRAAIVKPGTIDRHFAPGQAPPLAAVFPGAFNPPHAGHLQMATIAEQRLGTPLAWELSISNVDKPPLDFLAMRERVGALRAQDPRRPVALTRAPTFREKAAIFPGVTFIVGADTLARIAAPRYYGDNLAERDAAIAEIAAAGCRFLMFGRVVEGRFQTLADLQLPEPLLALCDEVPADEFREDISSTEIRGGAS